MTLCVDNQCEIIEKFDKAIQEVMQTMVGEKLKFLGQLDMEVTRLPYEVVANGLTVVMGYAGGLQGTISISMPDVAAITWTRSLIDHQSETVDQTVIDAVGELGNIVVGTAKRQLAEYNLSMSLPSVIRGGKGAVVFPSSTKAVRRLYDYATHELALTIALSSS